MLIRKWSKIFVLAIPLLSLSPLSNAGWSSSTGEVTRVYSHNGNHVIRTTLTDPICAPGNYWWPANDPDAKDMFSLAITALTTGKKIGVAYDPADPDCRHGNSAKISYMYINR